MDAWGEAVSYLPFRLLGGINQMKKQEIVGSAIVFDDAYTGEERYGQVGRVHGNVAVISLITKDEAGPAPTRIKTRADSRVAALTHGTGLIE
jgi:hypothetical protein